MKLIAERLGRNDKLDRLRCIRRDGSETATSMPRQGILPHDLVHYVVESGLGWRHGFLGSSCPSTARCPWRCQNCKGRRGAGA
jgi:hypothetical protein